MLIAVKIPGALVLVQIGQIAHKAIANVTAVHPQKSAAGVIAATGLANIDAETVGGVAGESLDHAAQIAGRGHAQGAGARFQPHGTHILAGEGARRRKAVIVAILLIAQRHPVHGEAQLLGGEAVHHQGFILLVIAPGIGSPVQHARQRLDGFQRRNAGQNLLRLDIVDLDRRMGAFAVRGHDHGLDIFLVVGRHGLGRGRCSHRAQSSRQKERTLERAAQRYGHRTPGFFERQDVSGFVWVSQHG